MSLVSAGGAMELARRPAVSARVAISSHSVDCLACSFAGGDGGQDSAIVEQLGNVQTGCDAGVQVPDQHGQCRADLGQLALPHVSERRRPDARSGNGFCPKSDPCCLRTRANLFRLGKSGHH
jgi:hypothetical protein